VFHDAKLDGKTLSFQVQNATLEELHSHHLGEGGDNASAGEGVGSSFVMKPKK
jgi:hypothetical protein